MFAAIGLVFGLAACAPAKLDMSNVTAVIDVRTPAEYAEGHLDGALNLDVNAADFHERVMQLDPAGKYIVYCKSGNRAGAAIEMMTSMNFTDLTNAGGIANAAVVTGLAIVQ
ncbi:MAG: rhodanese-like domain-containing protein [Micrococcales bacterium]